jgi:hypothetical protein
LQVRIWHLEARSTCLWRIYFTWNDLSRRPAEVELEIRAAIARRTA